MNRVQVCLLAAIAALASQTASAYTWSGWNGDGNWNDPSKWSFGGVPSAGVDAGALVQSGTITIDGTSGAPNLNAVLDGWNSGSPCAINMTGGSLTVTGNGSPVDQCLGIGWDHTGTFTQSGGTNSAALVYFGTSAGTYNLDGGTLAAGNVRNAAGQSGTLNLNGGTLQATASGAWIDNQTTIYVKSGGAVFDTQGFDVSNGSYLFDGGGGLTKNGDGSLTLSGINSYTGATVVNAGTLIFNAPGIQALGALAGAGNVAFIGNQDGYYQLKGTLTHSGTTTINLATGSQPWFGTIFAEGPGTGGPGLFSASSVLNVVSGKADLRCDQTVAGLTGSGGYVTTDYPYAPVLTVNTAAGQSYSYSGVVGGTPDDWYNSPSVWFTKAGPGTQVLAGANTYSGATTVNEGTLLVDGSLAAGSAVAVNAGGTLGGTGTIGGSVAVNAGGLLGGTGTCGGVVTVAGGGILAPGGTNSVGTLTASDLAMVPGAVYAWECNAVTSDLVSVQGTVTLSTAATIVLIPLEGASLPSQGVLLTYGVTNNGATDLGGWTVSGTAPGTVISFTDDAANKRVLYAVTAAAEGDGVWNKGGDLWPPSYPWNNAGNWVDGIVADGTDRTAHFDAVDSALQYVDLGGGSRTIGHLIFSDTEPSAPGWWGFVNGTLNLRVTSGSPVIEVRNANHDVGLEQGVTLTGDFTKTGPGSLYLKNFPVVNMDIAEGQVVFLWNEDNTFFSTQSISGGGSVHFIGQSAGYFTFRAWQYTGALTYTGHTIVELTPGSGVWWQGTLWLEKDDILPHATVVDLLSGKIYLREQTGNGLTVAGLTGNAGTYITTDHGVIQKWTLDVSDGVSCAYAGTIGADGSDVGNNNVALVKKGLGTQVLSGANTYVGATAVDAGALLVNGSLAADSAVSVNAGGTLGGVGTVYGAVAVAAGGTLAPGGAGSVGTLTCGGSLALAEGAVCDIDCASSVPDTVGVGGELTLPATATVNVSVTDVVLPKQITLFTAGSLAGATELSGWQARAGARRYRVTREGVTVVATLVPVGTFIGFL